MRIARIAHCHVNRCNGTCEAWSFFSSFSSCQAHCESEVPIIGPGGQSSLDWLTKEIRIVFLCYSSRVSLSMVGLAPNLSSDVRPSDTACLCIRFSLVTMMANQGHIWVCLKIRYIPNYSHLIGIMIINHWV